ncbi:MAG TPA: c-type cytochrome [Gemmatimonadales bacterium]|jgi:hypothetical protein
MNGGGRSLWSRSTWQGLHTSTVFLAVFLGCGGDRRSGAVPADTSRAAVSDTSTAMATDTAAPPARDTAAAAARPDTTLPRGDTGKSVAAKPATPKPAAKPAPKPAPTKPARFDTAAAAQPAETTTTPPTQASAPLRDPYHTAPLDTVSQQVYDGWKQFNLNCARCHGEDVQGTTIAPHLIVSLRPDGPINTKELFIQTVCAGRPAKGMPSWCALGMEMPTIEAIYSYVKGRSDAKIHPGRPAVKTGG